MPELKQHVRIPYAESLKLGTEDLHALAEWVKANDPRDNHRGRIECVEWDVGATVVMVSVTPPKPADHGYPDGVAPDGHDEGQELHVILGVDPPAISDEAVTAFTIENVR